MASLRRRNVASSETSGESSKVGLDTLRRFDVYPKLHDDYVQKSQSGGAVSLVTGLILAALLWPELLEFCTVTVVDSMTVDTRINQQMSINVDVLFPRMRCEEVVAQVADSSGIVQSRAHGMLKKESLDSAGRVVEEREVPPSACFPCLAAEDDANKCCNTCRELKRAYAAKNLSVAKVLVEADQCKWAAGCKVTGDLVVNKINGQLHIGLETQNVKKGGRMVHEYNPYDILAGFNTSHRINTLLFGTANDLVAQPLQGEAKMVRTGVYAFHYFIKLVPTLFTNLAGDETYAYQYTYSDNSRNVFRARHQDPDGLPGVFLAYDFSPYIMQKTEKAKPWSYIFTSTCAIVGGVFSVATLFEKIITGSISQFFGCSPIV